MIYQPAEDSYLLIEQVKKYSKNKKVLDIGSGSGIQAKTAISSGAKYVLATDVQDEVIKSLKKQKIPYLKSDLFSEIKGKFDLIIFNPPYLPEDSREDEESSVSTTGGKLGDEIVLRFLEELPKHLSKKGICLLLISSLTPKSRIYRKIGSLGLRKAKVSSKKLFMEELFVLKIENNNNP